MRSSELLYDVSDGLHSRSDSRVRVARVYSRRDVTKAKRRIRAEPTTADEPDVPDNREKENK